MEYINPNISQKIAEKLSSIERQFIFMRAEGASIRDIAKKMKKSTHTVCNMNKKFSKQIFNIRNAQFSDLQKKVIIK
ncbi:MAG: helix-turn-helix domain-containing protein [Ignavibacteriae bacterium]|nr:helix-turn-helix domain-containing protein [Ignavibacteriota bacterium]